MVLARFIALVIAGLMLSAVTPTAAEEVDRIAAVVNDDIISIRDLDARVRLALVVSNLPDSLENRRRLLPQVMRKMIDEHLQMQEAARVKIQVSSEELNRAIASIERQNRMKPGELLAQLGNAGVDTDAVREQIRADIAWMRVVGRLLQPTVRVGEEEITERLENIRQQIGHPEYMLAEIVLPVDTPVQEEEARRLGERLLDQIKAGAPFQALARQFSQSSSAANGGMLGWIGEASLDDDLRDPVGQLNKGQVSGLIRGSSGYSIVLVVDRRITGATAEPDMMTLFRLVFPAPSGKAPPRDQMVAKATSMTATAKDCDTIEDLSNELNSSKSGRLDNVRPSSLPPEVAKAINGLPVGRASAPIDTPDGLAVFMICSGGGTAGLPSRSQLRRQIEDERVELLARRHIRDLRRAAFVDFRL
ncbi:Parvulin-like peptidyl-prolyl isomerase [Magnetospirillum molischianum DSM 120]|uniref:Parvulin-like PPIase n=2 Tax=Magnetospirillum molischianum TaxID=1083 RepID=H8FPI5_MAGML|nr:peptidylprolyl isomerase [Magnetospirillum molischianum]CCG40273.1 Parvulin-like peptidyl-prolyl isomerase [Magnetospirillum molischianum DSM 120]